MSSSSSSSSSRAMVEWLYNPWAISWRAKGFFWPEAFLILARLFWNQILIWFSCSWSSRAKSWRRFSVRYRFSVNSVFSRASCSEVNAVRGRFSSAFRSFLLLILLALGPESHSTIPGSNQNLITLFYLSFLLKFYSSYTEPALATNLQTETMKMLFNKLLFEKKYTISGWMPNWVDFGLVRNEGVICSRVGW